VRWAALVIAVLALAGCSAAPEKETTVTVFAAASLTESFEQLADEFESLNPGVDVVFSFGGSSGLATQIVEGAPADVFAAASPATMESSGLTGSTVFATNVLEIVVPADNEAGVTGLADFANPELAIAVCAVEVPCGAAADRLLTANGIALSADTYEQDVKAVLTKARLGVVDAGLVYVTDVLAGGDEVRGIPVESEPVDFPIAAVTDRSEAEAFIAFVLSKQGQAILAKAGFGAP